MNYLFSKPFPLSSSVNHQKKQKNFVGEGVEVEKSLYYWWFEYLRRSKKYHTACANTGKGMKTLYKDFGDVFSMDFWKWWFELDQFGTHRGARLFATAIKPPISLVTKKELIDKSEHFFENNIALISICKYSTKTEIHHALDDVLRNELRLHNTKPDLKPPKYPPHSIKVDIPSLRKSLIAYDMHQRGVALFKIGAIAQGMDEVRDKEFFDVYQIDYRTMKSFSTSSGLPNLDELGKKLKIHQSTSRNMRHRPRISSPHNFFEPRKKAYLISHAHRLIKKAEANIRGVEKGMFPFPHKP